MKNDHRMLGVFQEFVVILQAKVQPKNTDVMKHSEFVAKSLAVVKMAVLVGMVAMFFSVPASSQCRIERLEDSTIVFSSTHQDPQFRGGERALMKYLQDNIRYPAQAVKDSVEGRVVVQFVIDSLGYVGEAKVLRSVRRDLDQEALRVVKTLPRFSPGRENGKSVNALFTLPVTFKLKSDDAPAEPEVVVVDAAFPGGEDALEQFLKEHIKYPAKAVKKRVEGRVDVAFIVDKTGKLHDFRVVKSADKDLDREALRVCRLLPDFNPATKNGEPVEVLYTISIRFKIQGLKHQYSKPIMIDAK